MPGKPGSGGPPPKRESQRRRNNKPVVPVTKAVSSGEVAGPELEGDHSDLGRRWWEALRRSGQSQFFEPSDWAQARIAVVAIDVFAEKPSAALLLAINTASVGLLVTEGERRRLHIELERAPAAGSEQDAAISDLADYRTAN